MKIEIMYQKKPGVFKFCRFIHIKRLFSVILGEPSFNTEVILRAVPVKNLIFSYFCSEFKWKLLKCK